MYIRYFAALCILMSSISSVLFASPENPKILHISFHIGCVKDIEAVAQELNLDVTSWYIHDAKFARNHLDGVSTGNVIYNMSHDRVNRIWEKHKDYFDQFDVIFTSDTAPLARVFLQNGWKKPLIIWICNRFDYYDIGASEGNFPDAEFYDLFRKATKQPNVKIIGYTEFEHHYAAYRGVHTDRFTITPVGSVETEMREGSKSSIPPHINQQETTFIYPRLGDTELRYLENQCASVGIKTYSGAYNGPCDLEKFRGVIYFPYQYSNLALFEDMQRGIVHFVPSESFITQLARQGARVRWCRLDSFHLVEWYNPEHRSSIVYFDSWADLKHKIETTDYDAMSKKIKAHAFKHRATMLDRWRNVFTDIFQLL